MYLTGGTVETGISAALADLDSSRASDSPDAALDSSRASDSDTASQGEYLLSTCNIPHVYVTRGGY